MEKRKILGYATPKKGMEDIIRGMNLDQDKRYEILEKIKSFLEVLGIKTESGKTLYHYASFFDVEPVDLLGH